LWTAQKLAILALTKTILGEVSIATLLRSQPATHKRLANAPRRRLPHMTRAKLGLL
jgi:hypothetical protein